MAGLMDDRRTGTTTVYPLPNISNDNVHAADAASDSNAATPPSIQPDTQTQAPLPAGNSYALSTPSGNQQFFINAIRPRIVDTVMNNADTTTPGAGTPGGGIKIGNGSTDLIFENCVFRTYTGSDQALNVQAFLTQPPVLPRRSVREQAECAHKTVSGLPRDY